MGKSPTVAIPIALIEESLIGDASRVFYLRMVAEFGHEPAYVEEAAERLDMEDWKVRRRFAELAKVGWGVLDKRPVINFRALPERETAF